MNIKPINFINNTTNKLNFINQKHPSNAYQECELKAYPQNYYISFGKLTNKEKLENIGEENFPSPVIYEQFKSAVEREEPVSLYDLHISHYKALNECKTLEEAKGKYPEFKDVKDAKDLPYDEMPRALQWITTGKNNKVKIEDFTLSVLKDYYYGLRGLSDRKAYFGIDTHAMGEILPLLNIKMLNKNYRSSVSGENPEKVKKMSEKQKQAWKKPERMKRHQQILKEYWQNPEYRAAQSARAKETLIDNPEVVAKAREGLAQYYADPERLKEGTAKSAASYRETAKNPEYKKLRSEISKKNWENPEYRELRTAQVIAQWQDPEHRKHCSEVMKDHWQNNDEFKRKQELHAEALRQAWANHPEFSQTMSDIAQNFHPQIGPIIHKTETGQTLTDKEDKALRAYYKQCHAQIPNLQSIIAGEAHQLLIQWGAIPPDEED